MNVLTTATKITIARIILIVPTVIIYVLGMLLGAGAYLPLSIVACILFSVLCATDFVDGNLARKTNTVSDLGKFLDPLADKVVIVVMLFLLVYFKDYSVFAHDGLVLALLSGLILSRELMISVFRAIASKNGTVLAADIYGKLKTVFLDIGVALLIIAGLHEVLAWMGTIVFYIGALLTVYSGFNYIIKNKAVFKISDAQSDKAGANAPLESKNSVETKTDKD